MEKRILDIERNEEMRVILDNFDNKRPLKKKEEIIDINLKKVELNNDKFLRCQPHFNHAKFICPNCNNRFCYEVRTAIIKNIALELTLYFCSKKCKLAYIFKKQNERDQLEK